MRFKQGSHGIWSLSHADLDRIRFWQPLQLPDEISRLVFVRLAHGEKLLRTAADDASTSPSPMKAACLQAPASSPQIARPVCYCRRSSTIESRMCLQMIKLCAASFSAKHRPDALNKTSSERMALATRLLTGTDDGGEWHDLT